MMLKEGGRGETQSLYGDHATGSGVIPSSMHKI